VVFFNIFIPLMLIAFIIWCLWCTDYYPCKKSKPAFTCTKRPRSNTASLHWW